MALDALDLLARIIAAHATGLGRLHRLAVHNGCTGLSVFARRQANLDAQFAVESFQGPIIPPAAEIVIHCFPRRQVVRQHAPLTACVRQVKDRIEDFTQFHPPGCPRSFHLGQVGRQLRPLFITQIGWIGFPFHYRILPQFIKQALRVFKTLRVFFEG